jgi:tetratricopeptide (TPR) repeat protein
VQSRWLHAEGRYAEAAVCFFEASRRDPEDANNLQGISECLWLLGELPRAEKRAREALAYEADHGPAALTLAATYMRQLQELSNVPHDALDRSLLLPPRTIETPLESDAFTLDPDELPRRCRHFIEVALAALPEAAFAYELRGLWALHRGWATDDSSCFEEARQAFERARELAPGAMRAYLGSAEAYAGLQEMELAEKQLVDACEQFYGEPEAYLARAALLSRCSDQEAAAAVLERGIVTLRDGREQLAEPLYRVRAELDGEEAAAARLREIAQDLRADESLLRNVAELLDEDGQRGHAIALLRHVVEGAPADVAAVFRLGKALAQDFLTREEGLELLERAMSLAPTSPIPRRELAWLWLTRDAERGLQLLESVRAQEDPFVFDAQSALFESLGRTQEASAALELAFAAFGDPIMGVLRLADFHIEARRYDRAVWLCSKLPRESITDSELAAHADYYWLAAHRLAGKQNRILGAVQALCADNVPAYLAWDIYWAFRTLDPDLAARAALTYANDTSGKQRLIWQINAAAMRLKLGDASPLDDLTEQAADSAEAWAHISWAYWGVTGYRAKQDAAAERAYEIAPEARDTLIAMGELALRRGDVDAAFGYATQLLELYPYEHQGPERLAILYGKSLQVEPALQYSERAVDAAPFCHHAQDCRAIALFVAGQREFSLMHAERSLGIEPQEKDDDANDALMIKRALSGDVAGVERCLASFDQPESLFADYHDLLLEIARRTRPPS